MHMSRGTFVVIVNVMCYSVYRLAMSFATLNKLLECPLKLWTQHRVLSSNWAGPVPGTTPLPLGNTAREHKLIDGDVLFVQFILSFFTLSLFFLQNRGNLPLPPALSTSLSLPLSCRLSGRLAQ